MTRHSPALPAVRLWMLRLWRAASLTGLALLAGWQARRMAPASRSAGVTIEEARSLFPSAAALSAADGRGSHAVYAADGSPLGSILRTAPETNTITGYSGPHDLLVGLNAEGSIEGVRVLSSGDTPEHIATVMQDPSFLDSFRGWNPGSAFPQAAAVSGATLTSASMAEALQSRLSGGPPSLRFPDEVSLDEVRHLFPEAAKLSGGPSRLTVTGSDERLLGYALRSAPASDSVSGYRGPSESLIALEADGMTIAGIRLRKSYDTESYVQQIRDDAWYLQSFKGRTAAETAAMDFAAEGIEGVSGATRTSWAVAEGIKRRLALPEPPESAPWRPAARDWMGAGAVTGALILAFTRLRGIKWLRITWQALLMIWALWTGGDLISLALLAGWAQHGIPWAAAPGAALIAGTAFFIPWAARRQLYCHQICPHGAAQQWLGKLTTRKIGIPGSLDRILRRTPWLLLCASPFLLLTGCSLAHLEAFDAWIWRAAALVPAAIAGAGLIASIFIPQAYCRYACPTGALLAFARTSGAHDRFGWRDRAFIALLAAAGTGVALSSPRMTGTAGPDKLTVRGTAMGTTWEVTVRAPAGMDSTGLHRGISGLLEEIENELSNWRPQSALSRSNAARTTAAQSVSPRLSKLVMTAAGISAATGGAFDITAGPLVRLWGFGPPPRPDTAPHDGEIAGALAHTGWQKIIVEGDTIRRTDPLTEIDLTSLTEGAAAGEIASLLKARGAKEFLINMGGELLAQGVWPVAIEHPMRSVLLHDTALATSGTYRQNRTAGGKQVSHLINPATGRPAEHRTVSVSVRHPDCIQADGWATALNVMGREVGFAVAEQWEIAAEFVEEDGSGHQTVTATKRWMEH